MKKKQISYAVAAMALVAGSLLSSCSNDDDKKLPPIGGFNSADEVAAANLVAHWPLDGNGNEKKSGSAPASTVNASFTTGAKGQALSLAAGYLSYNEIATLNNLPNFTISAWVKVSNNRGTAAAGPSMIFSMTRPGDWIGNINLMAETEMNPSADTLRVKGLFASKKNDGSANIQDNINDISQGGDRAFKVAGSWAHVVVAYDGATSVFKIYGNGKDIGSYDNRNGAGPVTFFTPTKPLIGAFGTNLPGGTAEAWQKPMTGQIDEIRVYNKALTATEASSLYQLELAGR
jgi:hypothetical protein